MNDMKWTWVNNDFKLFYNWFKRYLYSRCMKSCILPSSIRFNQLRRGGRGIFRRIPELGLPAILGQGSYGVVARSIFYSFSIFFQMLVQVCIEIKVLDSKVWRAMDERTERLYAVKNICKADKSAQMFIRSNMFPYVSIRFEVALSLRRRQRPPKWVAASLKSATASGLRLTLAAWTQSRQDGNLRSQKRCLKDS